MVRQNRDRADVGAHDRLTDGRWRVYVDDEESHRGDGMFCFFSCETPADVW